MAEAKEAGALTTAGPGRPALPDAAGFTVGACQVEQGHRAGVALSQSMMAAPEPQRPFEPSAPVAA